MKKTALLAALFAMFFMVACETAQDTASVAASDAWLTSANTALSNVSVTGFAYKQTSLPKWKFEAWAKLSAPVVKEILAGIQEGYVLQVTGHADARGPETAEGSKPGNIKISTDRAENVFKSLKASGIDAANMTFKGVGSSMPLDGVDPKDGAQRRVSFIVVAK